MSERQKTTSLYTSGEYAPLVDGWHEDDAGWKASQVAQILRRNRVAPGSIADIGCGTGGVLEALAAELPPETRLIGVEPSPQALDLARKFRSRMIELRLGTVAALHEHVDLLMALDVFEHVEDFYGFLRDLLGRSEYFVFHIPLDMNVMLVARPGGIPFKRNRSGHLHYFSHESALRTLQDAGFATIDYHITVPALRTEGARASKKQRMMKGPRKLMFRVSPVATSRWLGGCSMMVLARAAHGTN